MGTFRVKSRGELLHDLFSGAVIGLVSIPVSMGYARIAGLPPKYGLYGSLLPVLVFCIVTGSPRFVFTVDAAPAALAGSLVAVLGVELGSGQAVEVMPFITVMTALWLWLLWAVGAGNYVKYISEAVLGGCVSGIAAVMIVMQIPGLFGGDVVTGRGIFLAAHISNQAAERFHWLSFGLGTGTLALILLSRRYFPRFSMSLCMMIAGIVLTAVFHIDRYGVALLDSVEPGLPAFARADVTVLEGHFGELLLDTGLIAVVVLSETLLSTKEVAQHYGERVNNQRELLAYALGNMAAAACGSCPVGGSMSRTKRAMQFHVNSQWMSVGAAAAMAVFLLLGTRLIGYLPLPVLTGIVVANLMGLQEFRLTVRFWKKDRAKFFIFLAAFAAEFFGLTEGVVVGAMLSFISFTVRATRQPHYFLGCVEGEPGFFALTQTASARPIAHTVLYQFNGRVFYANIDDFEDDILGAIRDDTTLVVVSGVTSVGLVAAERILALYRQLKQRGIAFYLAGHVTAVNEELIGYGAEELIREGAVKARFTEALAAGGLHPPYELDHGGEDWSGAEGTVPEGFAWAYGKYAMPRLEKLARVLARETLAGKNLDVERLEQAKAELAGEYWGATDEAAFLDLLEMSLALSVRENRGEMRSLRRLSQELARRRIHIERELILKGDTDGAQGVILARLRREAAFLRRHPEAARLMARQRKEYLRSLRRTDPELAAEIERLTAGAEESFPELVIGTGQKGR